VTRLRRLLDWLRVTDDDGRLSLTHLSLGVALYCTIRGVQVSWTEWAAVVVTLSAYQAKKYLAQEPKAGGTNDPGQAAAAQQLAALEARVGGIDAEFKSLRSGQAWAAALGKR